jgi:hypothetical protein
MNRVAFTAMTFHLSRVGMFFAGAMPAPPRHFSKLRVRWFVSCLSNHSSRVTVVTSHWPSAAAIAAIFAATTLAGAATAGSDIALQSVSNPAGFTLLVPASWRSAGPAFSADSPIKALSVSPDGKEMLRVSVSPQTIQTSDLATFVSLLLGNITGLSISLGAPQSVDVAGAAGGVTQSLRYTDSSGARLDESVVAAVTGSTLYVVEVVTPAGYADKNAAVLSSIVSSLQITGR